MIGSRAGCSSTPWLHRPPWQARCCSWQSEAARQNPSRARALHRLRGRPRSPQPLQQVAEMSTSHSISQKLQDFVNYGFYSGGKFSISGNYNFGTRAILIHRGLCKTPVITNLRIITWDVQKADD